MSEINELPTREQLFERYAKVQNITLEEAKEQIDAPTTEEILKNIEEKTIEKINSNRPHMNRAQRRALKRKMGAKKYAEMMVQENPIEVINDTAKKLDYIDLIQKLRELNEKKEKENEEIKEEN